MPLLQERRLPARIIKTSCFKQRRFKGLEQVRARTRRLCSGKAATTETKSC